MPRHEVKQILHQNYKEAKFILVQPKEGYIQTRYFGAVCGT